MFEVTLSHVLPNGSRKFKCATLEVAKRHGDAFFSSVKMPGGRNGAAPFGIVVTENSVVVACRDLPDGAWKDVPQGWQEFPKMIKDGVIVHSREEEEAALRPAAAAVEHEDGAESTKKGKSRGKA